VPRDALLRVHATLSLRTHSLIYFMVSLSITSFPNAAHPRLLCTAALLVPALRLSILLKINSIISALSPLGHLPIILSPQMSFVLPLHLTVLVVPLPPHTMVSIPIIGRIIVSHHNSLQTNLRPVIGGSKHSTSVCTC
jgi:hypothetical protein